MPTKTWNINQLGGNVFYDENISGVSNTTSGTGWTVGKTAAGRYSDLANGTERNSNTFGTTALPNNTNPVVNITLTSVTPYTPPNLLVSSDSITTAFEYNGVFPAGTWTFAFPVIAVSNGGAQDGRINLRVFKASRSGDTFSGTTELTTAALVGSTVTNLTTSVVQTSTVSWSAPAFRLDNEYLIVKIAWEITGSGNNNTQDVLLRFGPASTMVSPNFKIKRQSLV